MTESNDTGPTPPPLPPPAPTPEEEAQVFQETVIGFNYRGSDNVIQLVMVAIFVVIGAAVGALGGSATFGAVGGLIIGAFVSGFVLMIRGQLRARDLRRRKQRRG